MASLADHFYISLASDECFEFFEANKKVAFINKLPEPLFFNNVKYCVALTEIYVPPFKLQDPIEYSNSNNKTDDDNSSLIHIRNEQMLDEPSAIKKKKRLDQLQRDKISEFQIKSKILPSSVSGNKQDENESIIGSNSENIPPTNGSNQNPVSASTYQQEQPQQRSQSVDSSPTFNGNGEQSDPSTVPGHSQTVQKDSEKEILITEQIDQHSDETHQQQEENKNVESSPIFNGNDKPTDTQISNQSDQQSNENVQPSSTSNASDKHPEPSNAVAEHPQSTQMNNDDRQPQSNEELAELLSSQDSDSSSTSTVESAPIDRSIRMEFNKYLPGHPLWTSPPKKTYHMPNSTILNPRMPGLNFYDRKLDWKRRKRNTDNLIFEQNIRMLYIYSDIVELRTYAHKKLELLRIIPYRNSDDGIHIRFENPEFLTLSKSYFDRITIIVNNRERDIKFDKNNYEPVFVQLLFKKCA